jgi:hypothetical protein
MAGDDSAYDNYLNIVVKLKDTSGGGFPCEAIMTALSIAVGILAPELVGADIMEGVAMQAACGAAPDPTSLIPKGKGKAVTRRASKAIQLE